MQEPLRNPQFAQGNVVYFLGAGASKSICSWLPLARDLTLENLTEQEAYPCEIPSEPEIEQLTTFFRSWDRDGKCRRLPLEEALHVVRALDQEQYENPYGLVVWCLGKRLSVSNYEHRPFSAFESWLDSIRERRDVLITTNYDLLIEQAHANMPPGEFQDCLHCLDFGVRKEKVHQYVHRAWNGADASSVLLLKLHGSLSWLFCEHCGKYGLDPIWERAWDSVVFTGIFPACPQCNEKGTRRPVLVSPLKTKELKDEAIKDIWQLAHTALGEAREIVFAGFSLSPNDEAVRNLLTKGFEKGRTKKVIVVDPNPDLVKDNYTKIYKDVVHFAPTCWNRFLEEHFPYKPRV